MFARLRPCRQCALTAGRRFDGDHELSCRLLRGARGAAVSAVQAPRSLGRVARVLQAARGGGSPVCVAAVAAARPRRRQRLAGATQVFLLDVDVHAALARRAAVAARRRGARSPPHAELHAAVHRPRYRDGRGAAAVRGGPRLRAAATRIAASPRPCCSCWSTASVSASSGAIVVSLDVDTWYRTGTRRRYADHAGGRGGTRS